MLRHSLDISDVAIRRIKIQEPRIYSRVAIAIVLFEYLLTTD